MTLLNTLHRHIKQQKDQTMINRLIFFYLFLVIATVQRDVQTSSSLSFLMSTIQTCDVRPL